MEEQITEDRIIALETKLAYFEDFLNKLQDISVEHTETIELLRKENRLMAQKIKDMSDVLEGYIPNRRPPHY